MVRAADRAKNPARTSVWMENKAARQGSARKSEQPAGLDRDRIVRTSIRLLDTEGLAKFSMRRLAAELQVTAMSVYWYVDTKDDIFELALDTVFGEVELPDLEDTAQDWRDQLRQLAASYRQVLVGHPWVSPILGNYLNIGPHSLAFSHAVQQIIRRTGLPTTAVPGAISAVFQFAYGYGTMQGHFTRRVAESGLTPDEYYRQVMTLFQEEPQLEQVFDEVKDVLEARGDSTMTEIWDHDFNRALDLLIAGIEAMKARGAT
ncbi:TetR/AcrR family transcriptional regulator [Streptomyces sp. NPDC000410]|uniref:TetR/AcrR family transcriptional regulator n=1 Tax=Streptomyces sp. NPDC000410 TaxID=3154254 RepID=UPI00331B0172